jgi:phosphoribosylformylglycinamidine synthase
MRARVYVTLKGEVLDPQGEAVKKGLQSLGLPGVRTVRVGKVIDIELDGTADAVRAKLEDAARKLLANTVIEDYRIEIEG